MRKWLWPEIRTLRNAFRGVVVLPKHLHGLWELPTGDSD